MTTTADKARPARPDNPVSGFLYDLRWRRRRFRQLLGWVFVFAVSIFGRPTSPTLFWIGSGIAGSGMIWRLWASGFVHKNQVLATTGPYARVRHPLYTGNLQICLGFTIASGTWWAWPVGILFVLLFYPGAIAYEDRKLHRLFPDAWEPWARRTPALVPRLGGGGGGARAAASSHAWSFRQSLMENGEPIYVVVMIGLLVWLWRALAAAHGA